MPDIANIIRFENEHSALDFKAIQYRKNAHEDLLTDVLAMANADVEGDRHIVVGVKHQVGSPRTFLGVPPADFVDPATYQQLVHANIEPQLEIDYFGVDIDGVRVGVLQISGCTEQPYMMKKDFGRLKAGESFVRRGSEQARLTRSDLERMLARRARGGPEDAALTVSFVDDRVVTELTMKILDGIELASDRAKKEIESILEERRQPGSSHGQASYERLIESISVTGSLFGGTPYSVRSDEELRKNLENIKKTYEEDDRYEMFEKHAFRINVHVHNGGTQYIDDATLELHIPKASGLWVADRAYPKPDHSPFGMGSSVYLLNSLGRGYPHVTTKANTVIASSQHASIKHHRTTKAFSESLRLAASKELAGQTLRLEFLILGKNIVTPYRRELRLHIE